MFPFAMRKAGGREEAKDALECKFVDIDEEGDGGPEVERAP